VARAMGSPCFSIIISVLHMQLRDRSENQAPRTSGKKTPACASQLVLRSSTPRRPSDDKYKHICRTRDRMAHAACGSSHSTATLSTAPQARIMGAAARSRCGPPAAAEASSHAASQPAQLYALALGKAVSSAPASHAMRHRRIAGAAVPCGRIAARTMALCSLTATGTQPRQRMPTTRAVVSNAFARPGARTRRTPTRHRRVRTT
jgi:hypothetical protein